MHITLETDYAFRIVEFLVINKGKRSEAKKIAEATGVTLRFSLKILRKLVSAGIIKSYKGSKGGYEIDKEDEEITLYDIINAIEGEYVFSRCLVEGYCDCTSKLKDGNYCPFQEEFRKITEMVKNELKTVNYKTINE